jgi:hypothetical protein
MHSLKSTNHPGLYKLRKTYWCKIAVKVVFCERSLRTSSETEALKTLDRFQPLRHSLRVIVNAEHKVHHYVFALTPIPKQAGK